MHAVNATTHPPITDCLDTTVIDDLLGIMAESAVLALLVDVRTDVAERLERLSEIHVAEGSLGMIAQDAHDLTSMGGNFGLTKLADYAKAVERAARNNSLDVVRASIPTLISVGYRSLKALADHQRPITERAS